MGSRSAICEILCARLPNAVTTPESPEYKAQQEHPWSPTCWLPAACYVQPSNTAEVAQVLELIRKNSVKFAIRGGGHNANPGVNGVDGSGVVIDMSKLNTMSLCEDGIILRVGAGARWGDIYAYLEEHGRTAVGGRQKDVGIGGFMLGGGMPAFVNLHGLAVDSLKSCEVVLADSSITTASATENPELLRALKGGGTNFGIVTRYDIQTYPLVRTQYTVNVYDARDYANVLKATVELQEAMQHDPKIGAFVNSQGTFIAAGIFYAEPVDTCPKAFDTFNNLGSLLQSAVPTSNGTIKSLVDSLDLLDTVFRRKLACASSRVSEELYLEVHELCSGINSKHPKLCNVGYSIQPLSPSAIQIGEGNGGNTMGMEKIPQTVWAFLVEWEDEADDAEAEEALSELVEGTIKLAVERGQLLEHIFMNDANADQKVLTSYGEENVRRLRNTAACFDPEGVFQHLQNDGFLLRKI